MIARPANIPVAGPELLVALDVDGTILTHDGAISDRVLSAVVEVEKRGAHVVIATGRGVVSTLPVLDMLGLARGYAVSSNGAAIVGLDGGPTVLQTTTFDPEASLRAMRAALPEALFMVESANMERFVTGHFPPGELDGEPHVVSFEELTRVEACRVTLRAPGLGSNDMHALIDRAGLHATTYAVGWTAWLDIAPDGVTKAGGLEFVRSQLGIAREATVAVGDGLNDLEMFDWAAWSASMGQAVSATKERADIVVGSVADDGLADVLESLLD